MNEQELMLRIALVNSGDIVSIDSPIGELRGIFGRVSPAQDLQVSSEDLPEGAVGWDTAGRPTFVKRIDPDEVRARLNPTKRGSNVIAARGSNVEWLRADLDHRKRREELQEWRHKRREELASMRRELRATVSNIEADRAALARLRVR